MQDMTNDSSTQQKTISLVFRRISQRYQKFLDDITPFRVARWTFASVLYGLFILRIILLQGWYMIFYTLGIYHLSLFTGFLTPKIYPVLRQFRDDDLCPSLPTRANEEFRPFIRNLPEFKFCYSLIKSILVSFVFTFFELFDVYADWPLLIIYFAIIFCVVMRLQIDHMIKYRYLPFTHSKPKYQCRRKNVELPPTLSVPVVSQV